LVEHLAGLAVISLVVVLATPLLRGTPAPAQVAADATQLAAALRVTRAAAMAQNREMSLLISPAARAYASPAIPGGSLDPRTEVTLVVAPRERSSAAGGVRFFPSGRSTGGDIRLRLRHAEARVQVNWATGHVSVRR
jgi:general secretion pathway protein H